MVALRRRFSLALLALGLPAARGQTPGRMPTVGILQSWPETAFVDRLAAFKSGLRELGLEEGRQLRFEMRSAQGRVAELGRLAQELVDLKVDLIFAATTAAAVAAHARTREIPIVIAVAADPVGTGLAASLARPGGNVTGMTSNNVELAPRRLQLLRELVGPQATRAALLYATNDASNLLALRQAQEAARRIPLELHTAGVAGAQDLPAAFAGVRAARAEMLMVAAGAVTDSNARTIVDLAAQARLPAMYGAPEFVDAGGLMSYSTDFVASFRAAAAYVERILKGARPADLPIEQASKYLLVFNARAARTLGLSLPASLQMQVDRLVE
jgi:putative tryptophan/tyrosine transport system substrate-binding protein